MNKKYLALGGGICTLVAIVIGGVAFDRYRDQSIKEYFEESIEVRLGTDAECEVVDSSLFSSKTLIQNCIIKNDPNYESENLAYISSLEINSKNLTSQEQTEISSLSIEGVKLNFDIKYLPPSINLEQMLSQQPKFKSQDQKQSHNKDFFIENLTITDIQVEVNLPILGSKSFVVNDIILTNLDHDNYQEEIRLALEERVNTEVTAWLGENTQIVGALIIEAILNFAQLLLAS